MPILASPCDIFSTSHADTERPPLYHSSRRETGQSGTVPAVDWREELFWVLVVVGIVAVFVLAIMFVIPLISW